MLERQFCALLPGQGPTPAACVSGSGSWVPDGHNRTTPWGLGTPRRIEALQAGQIGRGTEEVPVPVRRPDGLVTEPLLNRPDVDTERPPQARGRVPHFVDASPFACDRPVSGAQRRAAMQLGVSAGGDQQITPLFERGPRRHDRQDPVGQGHPSGVAALGGLNADALACGPPNRQVGGG